jgi:hypothetical protein
LSLKRARLSSPHFLRKHVTCRFGRKGHAFLPLNFKRNSQENLVIGSQNIHVPVPDLVKLDFFGAEGPPVWRPNRQFDPGPFRVAEIPDMRDIGVILSTHDPRETVESIRKCGKTGIRILAGSIDNIGANAALGHLKR